MNIDNLSTVDVIVGVFEELDKFQKYRNRERESGHQPSSEDTSLTQCPQRGTCLYVITYNSPEHGLYYCARRSNSEVYVAVELGDKNTIWFETLDAATDFLAFELELGMPNVDLDFAEWNVNSLHISDVHGVDVHDIIEAKLDIRDHERFIANELNKIGE